MIRSHALLTTVLVLCGVCLAACSPAAPAATPTPILIAPTMTPTPVPAAENQITATNAGRMQELYKLGRGSIYGMSISPDGELLVLSTTIGVWVYRIADGEVLHYFEGEPLNWLLHHADIAWSPDGSMLAVTQKKNGVKIWDASTWELLAERIPENPDPFQPTLAYPGIAWSPDGQHLAVGTGIKAVWVWDKDSNTWDDWSNYTGQQIGLTWTPEGQLIMLGDDQTDWGLFDVSTGEIVRPLDWGESCCLKVSWSPTGELVLVRFYYSGGAMYHLQTDKPVFSVNRYSQSAWSPDGLYFATSHYEYEKGPMLRIYDTQTYEIIEEKYINNSYVALAWTQQGELLGIRNKHGQKYLWNTQTEESLFSLDEHNVGDSNLIVWEHNGLKLIEISYPYKILVRDAYSKKSVLNYQHITPIDEIYFSPAQGRIALVDADEKLTVVDLITGKPLASFNVDFDKDFINHVFFSPHWTMVAVSDRDGWVRVWDIPNQSLLAELNGVESVINLTWSPDGQSLWIKRGKESMQRYDIDLRQISPRARLRNTRLFWLSNGEMVAAKKENEAFVFWLADSGRDLFRVDNPNVNKIVQSPDGDQFALSIADENIQIWDATQGKMLTTLESTVRGLEMSWSPNGDLLAVGTSKGQVFIFDSNTGALVVELIGHKHQITKLTWSADGTKLYTNSSDSTFRVWGLP